MSHPTGDFLQLVPNRVESALRRLRETVWRDREELAVSATAFGRAHRPLAEAKKLPLRAVATGSAWGKLYDQRWCRVAIPTGAGVRYFEWQDQGEATAYVDGMPYYGFDVAHRRVALPEKVREVWIESYCCQSAIWHPDATGLSAGGSVFGGAFLVRRDDDAWTATQDLQCLFDLMMQLRALQVPVPPALSRFGQQPSVENATPIYRVLLHRLSEAIDAYDVGGVTRLRAVTGKIFKEFRDAKSVVKAALTGHAHIDLVWLWPERMGEAKAVHTFATMNRLMSLYPEFRFAYSQPASYRAVERRAPRLAKAVDAHVHSGQWQATGALDVESDTQLPCGEALARSFMLGQKEFKRLRGAPSRLLWLPDVFGYSGCLPQLMRLAGVEWFFTTKLTWSAITRFPHSSFVWRGNDGSEVVAHVTQNAGYNNRLDLGEIQANANGHTQAGVHRDFLHPTGYGDGGGGPTEEMCERARRLSSLAGMPEMAWEQPEDFFARLAKKRGALPVYQGECYLEYHRGTYTTHGDLKAAFRGLECALQVREAVAAAQGAAPDLTATWRRLVFAQFHDYIPGSSVAEVYAEGVPELQRLAVTARAEAHAALDAGKGEWAAFNPLPLPWRGWAEVAGVSRWLELPPLTSGRCADGGAAPAGASINGRVLANDRVRAEIDADGWLKSLSVDGRPIRFTDVAARAVIYPDLPSNYDAWDIDRHSLALAQPVSTRPTISVEVASSERVVLAVARPVGKSSTLTVRYLLVAGESVLRIEAEVDWHEQHTLLKLHFPTAYRGAQARFGAPFGSVLRGQQPGPTATEAQWEVPGSRWAAVSHDGEREGLALITESKYGFMARDGELTVSLLRSARITGCDDHRYAAPRGLSRYQPETPFTDQGRHCARLAVGAYASGSSTELHPVALADTLFTKPLVYRGKLISAGLQGVHGAPSLIPAWSMPLDQKSWVLRLHEVSGQAGEAVLALDKAWIARRCTLEGEVQARASIKRLPYKPYEIVSVRLEWR